MRSRSLFLLLLCVGCEEPESVRDSGGWLDDDDPMIEPIRDGEAGGLQQSVTLSTVLGSCSGILLNQSALLTAAHCVAPVMRIKEGTVEVVSIGRSVSIDPSRIWVHDAYHYDSGGAPSEAYDVAVVGLMEPVTELSTDLGGTLALVGSRRPEDGTALWINGQMDEDTFSDGMMHRFTVIDPLPTDDSRYPYQLLDTVDSVVNRGDSGGPLFRERAGEDNDGVGGGVAPVVYGVVSRVGSYTRLDPIKAWIDERAADAARAPDEANGDWTTAVCNLDWCPVYLASDIDGAWELLGHIPRDQRPGIVAQRRDAFVVSYPLPDREYRVQVIDRDDFVFGGADPHGPPPPADLRMKDIYCAAYWCPVFAKRDLADAGVTALENVPCGRRMGVLAQSRDWSVVSGPMVDRNHAVKVVPRGDGVWSETKPGC